MNTHISLYVTVKIIVLGDCPVVGEAFVTICAICLLDHHYLKAYYPMYRKFINDQG